MRKQERWRGARYLSGGLACALWLAIPAAGMTKDLATLAEAVIPAYTAMNIGLYCNQYDAQFLAQTSGPRGTAIHYAEHVKDEAIATLTYVEATTVLRSAADTARDIARRKVRELEVPGDDASTLKAIRVWCDAQGRAFVRQVIERHDSGHDAFADNVRRAQQ